MTFVKTPNSREANQLAIAIYKGWPWIWKRGYLEKNSLARGQTG